MIDSSAASGCLRCLLQASVRPRRPLLPARVWLPTTAFLPPRVRDFRTAARLAAEPSPASPPPASKDTPNARSTQRPPPRKPRPRRRRWPRRLAYLALLAGAAALLDHALLDAALRRSARTFALGLVVAADYKLNFRADPWLDGTIEELHARSARRLFELLRANGGLYLKIGQAVAMQSAILPPEFQRMFARMFDDAPQNAWPAVARVIREDFGGRSVEAVFGVSFSGEEGKGVMERTARASASVAQVHWARLPDGREVAIKVQKREIANQVGWDLWTFRVIAWIYSRWFDMPYDKLVPYITERLMLETDFENEAHNGERMAELVASEPRLRGRVYVPKVYHELSSKRVMTAEWVEGVRLWDKDALTRPWLGRRGEGSPGCRGAPLDPPGSAPVEKGEGKEPHEEHIKPARNAWLGPDGQGGLGLGLGEIMTTMVDLFSAQMFLWGWVHCDPHPGNIFIRRQPGGRAELVLIDHGLYIHMTPRFRHQYARFWTALLELDNTTIGAIAQQWGIRGGGGELFASATLMRPYTGGTNRMQTNIDKLSKTDRQRRSYEMQQQSRTMIREILGDEDRLPKELLFIGRNLRIVQGNNQFLGSPVNRIKITGTWASRALVESRELGWRERARNLGRHVVFRVILLSSDALWWWSKARQWLGWGRGMEDDMEAQMKVMAKEMGVDLNHKVFEG